MPIYEFKCENCDMVVEELCKIGQDFIDCSCGARANKIVSSPGNIKINGHSEANGYNHKPGLATKAPL